MKQKFILTSFLLALLAVILISLLSCNPIKQVLADIEKVKVVRAVTDPLFPCVNDTTIEFIHDSTEVEVLKRDTLIEQRNDSVFTNYFDTITKTKTVTLYKTIVVEDKRETVKLNDSLTNIRLREASYQGQILEIKLQASEYKKQRNLYVAILSGLLLLLIVFIIYKLKPKIV